MSICIRKKETSPNAQNAFKNVFYKMFKDCSLYAPEEIECILHAPANTEITTCSRLHQMCTRNYRFCKRFTECSLYASTNRIYKMFKITSNMHQQEIILQGVYRRYSMWSIKLIRFLKAFTQCTEYTPKIIDFLKCSQGASNIYQQE